jgi:Neurotransmitter-gated ion-channel ligand binding domain
MYVYYLHLRMLILFLPRRFVFTGANENAKRLFDDLLSGYNKLRRPVERPNQILTIKLKLRLSQIIDVHEKDQIMTTSVWLKQVRVYSFV